MNDHTHTHVRILCDQKHENILKEHYDVWGYVVHIYTHGLTPIRSQTRHGERESAKTSDRNNLMMMIKIAGVQKQNVIACFLANRRHDVNISTIAQIHWIDDTQTSAI